MQELADFSAHYDVLHVHGNLNAFLLSRLTKHVPIIYSVHDPPPSSVEYDRVDERFVRETVFRTIDIPALRRVDHVISVNPTIRQSLVASGVEPKKISVIPSGMRPSSPMPGNRDGGLGIFVGPLVHRKGAHYLVEALSGVPSLRLLIVGEGPEKIRLLELTKRLGCSERVTFCGYVPESKLEEYYAQASLGIFPTLVDAMPTLALLECMTHGIPPIVSKVPGADWVIRSGENGLLFRPRNVGELRELLSLLTADEHLRIRIGKNAKRHVDRNFTWDSVAERVESVYEHVRSG
jgi:glycosyltransferase involved in cell wall biosynthesis